MWVINEIKLCTEIKREKCGYKSEPGYKVHHLQKVDKR